MDIVQIKEAIKSERYNFLRENEHLGNNIILLTLGGSYAYGTNVEDSDLDIRGITLNRPQELLGFSRFEQVVEKETDTTVYGLNKMMQLLIACNPNTIEILGCKPEHYLVLTKEGKLLLDYSDLFLSQQVCKSFAGYANAQLRRLQNALARDSYNQEEKENHILRSIKILMNHIEKHYHDLTNQELKLYIDDSDKPNFEKEIFIDVNLKHYPLRDFKSIYSEMSNVIKDYDKLNHRNKKKDDLHLNKHAMHLVRLYLMGIDILEGKGVKTYRENDIDLLLSIRKGYYQKEDSTYYPEFFEMIDDLENKLNYAKKNTELPLRPNLKKIEELMIEINRSVIK